MATKNYLLYMDGQANGDGASTHHVRWRLQDLAGHDKRTDTTNSRTNGQDEQTDSRDFGRRTDGRTDGRTDKRTNGHGQQCSAHAAALSRLGATGGRRALLGGGGRPRVVSGRCAIEGRVSDRRVLQTIRTYLLRCSTTWAKAQDTSATASVHSSSGAASKSAIRLMTTVKNPFCPGFTRHDQSPEPAIFGRPLTRSRHFGFRPSHHFHHIFAYCALFLATIWPSRAYWIHVPISGGRETADSGLPCLDHN